MRKSLVAANWKMLGRFADIAPYMAQLRLSDRADVVLFPSALHLQAAVLAAPDGLKCGVQDVGTSQGGAHTGEISADMVVEMGGSWCIVGHSERRIDQGETDDLVATKASAALKSGLLPIVCVGETLAEREAGHAETTVHRQLAAVLDRVDRSALSRIVVGYEPVWAIGTGESASADQAQEMHGFIRSQLDAMDPVAARLIRIVYGGSVTPDNASELFAQDDIDGGLVGGASLDARAFSAIVDAVPVGVA